MRIQIKYICLTILLITSVTKPQAVDVNEIKLDFGGYVNWTAIYDSRQTVSAREGHFLLFPKPEILNSLGKDINAVNNFQLAVIQTRVSGKISGMKFLGASTSGLLEAEFMGNADTDVNGFRIRHAFLNLKWEKFSLLLGQYWIPLFVTEVFPDQIGSNGGAPFQPFGRNPQLRLTYQTGSFKFITALVTQRDYCSTGPNGYSSEYLKNAVTPDLHFQAHYNIGDNLFGAGAETKILKPGVANASSFYSDSRLNSYAVNAFTKISARPFTFKMQGIYGSNLTDYTMIGGYAVSQHDTVNNTESYTPIKTLSVWADIIYGSGLEIGLFTGYTKNLGADDIITGKYYSRGNNIKDVIRIAPRIQYKEGNTRFSFEIEYTTAGYGTPDLKGIVNDVTNVSNLRLYTSIFYFINL
ncbi:MAG: hypothetical protein R6W90_08160 [Ignavibacteriaceae bacterium]